MKDEALEEILEGCPPETRRAVEKALRMLQDEPLPPEDAVRGLVRFGLRLAKGIEPGPGALATAVEAVFSLIRWSAENRRRRRARRRYAGTKRGIIAWKASKMAGRKK